MAPAADDNTRPGHNETSAGATRPQYGGRTGSGRPHRGGSASPPPRTGLALHEESVRFFSGDAHCLGRLTAPATATPVPGIVLCTGFAGTQDTPALRATARAFATAGYAALTFDYRRFGASEGVPRQVIRLDDQLEDIGRALEMLRMQPRVNPTRLALWGTSLGGAHAIVAGSRHPEVGAVIAQVPLMGFPRPVRGRTPLASLRLFGALALDSLRALLRITPRYIPVAGRRNQLAVMASADAASAADSLDGSIWRNEVAPRVLLDLARYRVGDAAAALVTPLLVCIASLDVAAPEARVLELVERAPHARALVYRVRHFEVYRPDVRERILADQIAFLRDQL